jgi:hypothetical protein
MLHSKVAVDWNLNLFCQPKLVPMLPAMTIQRMNHQFFSQAMKQTFAIVTDLAEFTDDLDISSPTFWDTHFPPIGAETVATPHAHHPGGLDVIVTRGGSLTQTNDHFASSPEVDRRREKDAVKALYRQRMRDRYPELFADSRQEPVADFIPAESRAEIGRGYSV